MTVIDGGVIAVVVFFVTWGIWVGFIGQLVLVIALLLAFVVAGVYAPEFQVLLAPYISSPRLAFLTSYLLLLLAAYLGFWLMGVVLGRLVQLSIAPWFDRLLGGAFGFAKAYLLLVICYLVLAGANTPLNQMLEQSYSRPYLAAGADYLQGWFRDRDNLEIFRPREPAISSILPIPGEPPPGSSR